LARKNRAGSALLYRHYLGTLTRSLSTLYRGRTQLSKSSPPSGGAPRTGHEFALRPPLPSWLIFILGL